MTTDDKKTRVASALFDLTEREDLTWEQFRPDAAELPDALPAAEEHAVFAALHDEMDLYLYQEEREADETTPRLEVTDPESGAGWTFPEMDVVEDLYELVQFRAAGLQEWMDRVIAEAGGTEPDEENAGDEGAEEASGDAQDPVPSWAEDAVEEDDASDDEGPDEGDASEAAFSPDHAGEEERDPDVFGNGNGTAEEKEGP